MVVVDRFSKGCKLISLKGLPTAMQSAEAMFNHVFRNFGLPEDIVSDWGPQFTSRVCGSLCARLGIGVSLSSGCHPQSNGQAERLNQEIGRFLRTYCSREQQRWSEFLPWAEYTQNSLIHSSTGLTPFQCVLGYQPPLFPWSGEPSDVPAVEECYRFPSTTRRMDPATSASATTQGTKRATRLPHHHLWDCTIDLLPNAMPPKSKVYPLSLPESKAMEDYIKEALAIGNILPLTSPAAAGVFFVEKKDGGLRPCIDYQDLNALTDLQWFLGFTNFYKRFIRNYSSIANPLTFLLQGKPVTTLDKSGQSCLQPFEKKLYHGPQSQTPGPKPSIHRRGGRLQLGYRGCSVSAPQGPWEGSTRGVATLAGGSMTSIPRTDRSLQSLVPPQHQTSESPSNPAASSGHPGVRHTTTLIWNKFWWPFLFHDVEEYVEACATCAQSGTSCRLPTGLLEPLPIPQRPWSHMAVDFVTGLPDLEDCNTILVAIDRFSKACRLVPLKGLPTAMETATALFNQAFQTYGLPEDIVSDQGPQFTSRVWRAFCTHLGVNVNLSSGYHPQSI
ncbi:hypothetical protein QTP86_026218 [Hemibagrus guttatus]|nr:hypothetical protein QTP86_026218 [Hemibagrus guttatus]